MSPVSGDLAVSAAGAATSEQRRRQYRQLPVAEPEDTVELSSQAEAADNADEEPAADD